jgi:hypothetical protein
MRRIREVLRLKFQLGLNDTQVAMARATLQDYLGGLRQKVNGCWRSATTRLSSGCLRRAVQCLSSRGSCGVRRIGQRAARVALP